MKISRRRFILAALLAMPCAIAVDARWLEPQWVKINRLRLAEKPVHRFVYFSDLHHKGDRAHTQSVVKMINSLSPDFVCFAGDIVEEAKFLPESPNFFRASNHRCMAFPEITTIQAMFRLMTLLNVLFRLAEIGLWTNK